MAPLLLMLTIATTLAPQARGPHIQVALVADHTAVAAGQTFEAGIHLTMDPGWHVYWQHPGDSGEAPTIAWQLPEGWEAGPIAWPVPEALSVPPLMNYGYEREVLLATPIAAKSASGANDVRLAAHVSWLVCAQECIPGSANLGLTLAVRPKPTVDARTAALFEHAHATLPTPVPSGVVITADAHGNDFALHAVTGLALTEGRFFPSAALVIEEAAPQAWKKDDRGYQLTMHASEQLAGAPAKLQGLLAVQDAHGKRQGWMVDVPVSSEPAAGATQASRVTATHGDAGGNTDSGASSGAIDNKAADGAAPAPPLNPLQMIWFALLGGVILNLMPCVFPVLSIKFMSLVRLSGHEQHAVRLHAWLYALGILTGFWILTGALLVLRAAGEQIGWGFQLQSPGFVAGLVILLFMFGLSLLGVFEVGGSWMGVGQSVAGRRDAVGSFFTGLLATVVATPCSAPFMGSAVGFALTQAPWVCVAIFSALGAGLALPYLALCYIPPLVRWMPKPGAWMQTMQQCMGFLLMGTVLWLLWVLDLQLGSAALFVLMAMLLGLAVAAWALGRWGHHHRLIAGGAWVVIFALGGAAIYQVSHSARPNKQAHAADAAVGNLVWEKFSPERVRALRAEGRRIFVDFTAAWCVSCQVNERVVFGSQAVREKIAEKQMVLLKADWTDADPIITEALAAFGRSGVPLYVLYGKGEATKPVQLPEVITPAMVLDALGKLP